MKKALAVLAVALFVFTACQQSSGPTTINEYTGRRGLTLTFDENTPPNVIYNHQPFFVTLTVHNQGAYDVNESTGEAVVELNTNNLFYITPYNKEESSEKTVRLDGKSDVRPNGEETSLNFGRFIIPNRTRIGEIQDATETLQARVCYPYKTTMSDTLCIKNSFGTTSENPLCQATTTKTYTGTGAPVAVTKVENSLIPVSRAKQVFDRTELVFEDGNIVGTQTVQEEVEQVQQQAILRLTLQNVGEGRPVHSDTSTCESPDEWMENTVEVSAALGNTSLRCRPKLVHLNNQGKGTTRCINDEQQLAINTNYQSIFNVELDYTYITSKTKDINIQQRPGFN